MEEFNLKDKLSGRNEAAAIITAAIINKCDTAKVEELVNIANSVYRQVWSNINLLISPPQK